jgi:hypothetical protein
MGRIMNNPSALERLLADEGDLNEALLSDVLSRYVKIGKESGLPIFTTEFTALTNAGKILVYLLARKAAIALGVWKGNESATPKEISDGTGVAYDSVKPTISGLARSRLVAREGGRYSVPNHLLLQARELVR